MKIVAEGVENSAQVAFLKDHACDEMQGYFFGRPMSFDDFKKKYLSSDPDNKTFLITGFDEAREEDEAHKKEQDNKEQNNT